MKTAMSLRFLVALAAMSAGACGEPEIVVPDVLTIVSIQPGHGTIDVAPETEGLVYFSHDVAEPALLDAKISIECLGTPPCSAPDGNGCGPALPTTVLYPPEGRLARVTHVTPMSADTCYVLAVESGIASSEEQVGALPVTVRASFKTAP